MSFVPAFAYLVLVFSAGGAKHGPSLGAWSGSDKVGHLIAFGGLQVLIWVGLVRELPRLSRRAQLLWALLVTSAAGAALELYQLALPYRSAEVMDWVADTVGAGLASLVLWSLPFWRRLPEPPPELP